MTRIERVGVLQEIRHAGEELLVGRRLIIGVAEVRQAGRTIARILHQDIPYDGLAGVKH